MENSKQLSILESNNIEVKKVNPLFFIYKNDLGLQELQIIDVFFSKVKNNKNGLVKIIKKELENIFGKELRRYLLLPKLKNLLNLPIEYIDYETNEYKIFQLFTIATLTKDENVNYIKLQCHDEAREIIFNDEKFGYYKYALNKITKIKNTTTYWFFQYIEYNKHKVIWEESIENLKQILRVDSKSYNNFKKFNQQIIKKSIYELQNIMEYKIVYKLIKKTEDQRKIEKIEFEIIEDSNILNPIIISSEIGNKTEIYIEAAPDVYKKCDANNESKESKKKEEEKIIDVNVNANSNNILNYINDNHLEILKKVDWTTMFEKCLSFYKTNGKKYNIEYDQAYIDDVNKRYNDSVKIGNNDNENPTGYLISIVKNDISNAITLGQVDENNNIIYLKYETKSTENNLTKSTKKTTVPKNKFHNFEQRSYTEEELEELIEISKRKTEEKMKKFQNKTK